VSCRARGFYLFGNGDALQKPHSGAADRNIRTLELVSKRAGWLAADYFVLREEYQRTLAASGETELMTEKMWRARHDALEARKLDDERAKDAKNTQQDLLTLEP
jgi:hypothetical protein